MQTHRRASTCRRELPVSTVNGRPTLTRRRLIAIGTGAALGTAGLALGTQPAGAQADVSLGDLEIQEGELAPEDGEVYAPWVLLTGDYEYRVQEEPAEWEAYLLVYDNGGNSEAVSVTSGDATAMEATGSYALRGAITAASFWGPSDFSIPDGQDSVTVTVPIEVAFVVRDADGTMLVQDRVADDAVVTVTPGGSMATLSGAGEIVMQDDADDPTPELPEA